jgi:hypothetical protein
LLKTPKDQIPTAHAIKISGQKLLSDLKNNLGQYSPLICGEYVLVRVKAA